MQFLGEIIVIFVSRNLNAKTFSSECMDISYSVPKEKRTILIHLGMKVHNAFVWQLHDNIN